MDMPPPSRWLAVSLALLAGGYFVGACTEGRTCYAGDFLACTCEGGDPGFAACDTATEDYGACAYCGSVPSSAAATTGSGGSGAGGSGAVGGTGGAALLGFMETCKNDADCESGNCHTYNAKGQKCTISCQTNSDCPLPSPGCNNMKVCKAP